jgi:hypothetical protein
MPVDNRQSKSLKRRYSGLFILKIIELPLLPSVEGIG